MEAANQYVKLYLKDGILYGKFTDGLQINLPIAKEIVKLRLENLHKESYAGIVDIRGVKSVTKEAREYLGSEEASEGVKAGAILVESFFTKFIGNIFIRFSTMKTPLQIFTNEEDAINWLTKYK